MNEFTSINDFFSQIGCRFQCFDMGRLIQPVAEQSLIGFEQNKISWPTPFMQQAWLAILFWAPENSPSPKPDNQPLNHYVWFLKLPLDEQAKLNLVARDDFLRRLIEALSHQPEHGINPSDKHETAEQLHSLENAMKDNPYGFQPKQEQLANFHALAHKHLSLPPSSFYSGVQHYFASTHALDQWTELGYQGFADIAARLDEQYHDQSNQQLISQAIAGIPAAPFQVLGHCLENQSISNTLLEAIIDRVNTELHSNEDRQALASFCNAAIHATAQADNSARQAQLLNVILESSVRTDIEILASISGRCWQQLSSTELLLSFLEALAITEHGQGAFSAILSDLMFIPGMREHLLQGFRSPHRSEQLAQSIGLFFSQLTQKPV